MTRPVKTELALQQFNGHVSGPVDFRGGPVGGDQPGWGRSIGEDKLIGPGNVDGSARPVQDKRLLTRTGGRVQVAAIHIAQQAGRQCGDASTVPAPTRPSPRSRGKHHVPRDSVPALRPG